MKRILRILGWIAAVVVVLLVLAVIGLWIFFPVEKAKTLAMEKGSAQLGRDIYIEDAQVSFWGGLGIKLGNVTVSNPPEFGDGDFLRAEDVDVKLQIIPLLSGKYAIDRLVINRPEIVMHKRADGSNNYTFESLDKKVPPEVAEQTTPETRAAAFAVTFEKLEIEKGRLSYVDDSSGTNFRLNGLDLSTSLTSPRSGFYRSSGEISIDTLSLAADFPLPVLTTRLKYKAEYDVSGKKITFDDSQLELNRLKTRLSGEVVDPFGDPTGKLSLNSEKISVSDLFALLPESKLEAVENIDVDGDFKLDLDVEYDPANPDTLVYYGTAVITSMNLKHKDVPGQFEFKQAILDFKNDNLRFNIEDAYFDGKPVKGHLVVDNFDDPIVNGELAGNLDLAYLQPFLPAEDAHKVAGESRFNIKLSGRTNDFANMKFSGDLAVTRGSYSSTLLLEPIESFDLDVYFDNRLTSVKKLEAKTKSGSLSFNGRLNDLVPYFMADSVSRRSITPTIDGNLSGNLNLAVLNPLLPPKGNPQLQGRFDMDLRLAGVVTEYERLRPSGNVSITNASYNDSLLPEPLRHFEARLKVAPDTITVENMTAKFVSSDASFSGKLLNPFPYLLPLKTVDRSQGEKPLFIFKLTSHHFDADKLFPEAVPGSGENRTSVSLDSVSTVILPDIDGRGTFEVDTIIYSGVQFTSLVGKIKVENRVIECYDVTGNVYGGDISGTTTIDLNDFSKPQYSGRFKASNVEANDFISQFTKFGGFLYGKTNLEGEYSAQGWEPDDFLKSLTMNSDYQQLQGKLVTSGVVFSALSGLASKFNESFDKEQALKDLKTKITVENGRVSADKLTTTLGKMGDIEANGSFGLTDFGLNFGGTILLSEEYTKKLTSKSGLLGSLGGLLTDKSVGRIKLPLAFGGTIENPTFEIDYSELTKNLGDNLKQDGGNLLEGLIKKKK